MGCRRNPSTTTSPVVSSARSKGAGGASYSIRLGLSLLSSPITLPVGAAQGCRGKRRGCVCQRGLPRTACAAAAALCAVQGRCLLLKRCRVQGVGGLVLSINVFERVACARRNACNVCFVVVSSIYIQFYFSLALLLSLARAGSLCTRGVPDAGVEGGAQARVRDRGCGRGRAGRSGSGSGAWNATRHGCKVDSQADAIVGEDEGPGR